MSALEILPVPCASCPYRRDAAPGIWDASEYEKLRGYAEGGDALLPCLLPFLCHHSNRTGRDTLCRGWLSVEGDSIAVRLLLIRGQVTREEVEAPVSMSLYASGAEAAAAGLAGVECPDARAQLMAARLLRSMIGRLEEAEVSGAVELLREALGKEQEP